MIVVESCTLGDVRPETLQLYIYEPKRVQNREKFLRGALPRTRPGLLPWTRYLPKSLSVPCTLSEPHPVWRVHQAPPPRASIIQAGLFNPAWPHPPPQPTVNVCTGPWF